ncbi:PREDICTED: uncharacterized protein LOC107067672 [Polistes dominula]|uniref:Uncharacterized protein LOC107067672 n=1 Tax=Polistes dominula TaxID=743375 RepID=A0ABM1IF74_POLDO|nr:PREDICTED: uncharacterized protein LOC107067672 [Polistes dominula]
MEKVEHLWNVTQYLTKFQCPEAKKLQNHYIECCRNLSKEVELPKLYFGPSTMCSHCGSLWVTTNHQVRILPGKKMSRSVGKMIKTNTDENKISKLQAKLIKKCKKNEMNKMSIKCFACMRCTKVRFTKPKKILKTCDNVLEKSNIKQKKKKKKGRDRSVGLNISGNLTPKLQSSESQKTLVTNNRNQSKMTLNKPKVKKLNINKLKGIVNQGTTPPNRKSLTNFLKELL